MRGGTERENRSVWGAEMRGGGQRKRAKQTDLQELAKCNRADHGRSEKEYRNAQSNIKLRHLVSLMMLLPTSQCVRGDDAPMDISSAEQCSTPGSLIPACLTLSLFNLHPSLHLQPTWMLHIFTGGESRAAHCAHDALHAFVPDFVVGKQEDGEAAAAGVTIL